MQPLEVIPLECLRKLYAAALVGAIKDALKWKKIKRERKKSRPMQDKVWGEQAIEWIFDDSLIFNGFRAICDLIGLNYRKIRKNIQTGNYCDPDAGRQHWLRRYKFGERGEDGYDGRAVKVAKNQRADSGNCFVSYASMGQAV